MKRTILYAAAALLLGGCFKSVGYDTDVILKSWVQTESAAELKPAQGVVAYAFEADTVTWTVASYEDALNGVLTRKGTDEAGVSPVQGTAYRVDSVDMDLLLMRVGSTPVVVVAVDTESRLYGYRQQDLGENLPQLFTSVIFRPWKQMKKYVDGTWRMFNDFYVEEPDNPGGETGGEGGGTTAKKLVSVTVKPWNNGFKEFTDGAPDYGDKKAEIEKLQRKIAQVQELLDTSMTQLDLNKAILEKAQAVKEQEVNLKVAKLKLDKKLAELGDGNVYAEFDGTVKAVRDPDEAYNNSEAVVELSGGGGYYVTGTLSEMDLGSVQVGDSVSISSWMTGAACEGTIVSIDDYPTSNGNNWGDGNSNVSYYPFKVFVTEDANLQPNDYVDIQYQKDTSAEESGSSLYLQSMFIRTDNGKSYVMARGEDGRLEQRWVQTGRDLWGSYTQIRGGLTIDDYVAFPYGRDVVEGAHTQEATTDQLYNYGI